MLSKEDHRIADRNRIALLDSHLENFLTALRSNLNVKLLSRLRHLRTTVRATRMKRLHDSIDMTSLGLNDHALSEKLLWRNSTERLHPQKTILVNVTDNQSDLIHMSGDQHASLLIALLVSNQISHHIIRQLHIISCHLLSQQIRNLVLKSRRSNRITQRSNQRAKIGFNHTAV